jgi:hypothetical protein
MKGSGMSTSSELPSQVGIDSIWLKGADGERQAVRVDSRVTGGAYSVIESLAEPAVRHRSPEPLRAGLPRVEFR